MYLWVTGAAGGTGIISAIGIDRGMARSGDIGRGAGTIIPIGNIGITGLITATMRRGGSTGGGGAARISGVLRSA